jgi:hypothetical protein
VESNTSKLSSQVQYQHELAVILGLVVVGIMSRFLPHPPNWTAIGSVALLAGAAGWHRGWAFLAPFVALLLSDLLLGFHSTMIAVYVGFFIFTLLGHLYLRQERSVLRLAVVSTAGSSAFFVVSNLGVWLLSGLYPVTLQGLVVCFQMALPFWQNQFLGDLTWTAVLFGLWALARQTFLQPARRVL